MESAEQRAAAFWMRIRAVVRSHEGEDWPLGRGDAELNPTRRGRPIWKIGGVAYTLQDETRDPADDRVVEVTPSSYRVLAPGGRVVQSRRIGPGDAPELN